MGTGPGLEAMLGGGLGRSSQPAPGLKGSCCGPGQGDQVTGTSGAASCLNLALSKPVHPEMGLAAVVPSGPGPAWQVCSTAVAVVSHGTHAWQQLAPLASSLGEAKGTNLLSDGSMISAGPIQTAGKEREA